MGALGKAGWVLLQPWALGEVSGGSQGTYWVGGGDGGMLGLLGVRVTMGCNGVTEGLSGVL